MKKKLVLYSSILIGILVIYITSYSFYKHDSLYKQRIEEDLYNQALLIESVMLDKEGGDYSTLETYATILKTRITLVDKDGEVIMDTAFDPETMDNHYNRPEIRDAYAKGRGVKVRYSKTIGVDYLYVAIPTDMAIAKEGTLRLAFPLSDIKEFSNKLMKVSLIGIIGGTVFIVIILYMLIRQFLAPLDQLTESAISISKGNYSIPVIINGQEQVNKLALAFEQMRVDLKRNILKLKDQKEQLELILKSMVNGVIAVDDDYSIMFCNNAFRKIFDIEDEIKDRTIYEVIRCSELYQLVEEVNTKKCEKEKNVYNGDQILRVKAYSIKKSSVHVGCLLTLQDITKQTKLENIRKDFVSNVTHELKTPLTSIKGFVDTLRHGAIEDKKVATRFLDIIDIEVERLTTLINDTLELSDIENHQVVIKTEEVDMDDLMDEVMPLLLDKADKADLELSYSVQYELPTIISNEHRLKQLVINLVDNAIKYTEEGSIDVKVFEDQGQLVLQVKDTGIGISAHEQERIFERFYRVDKSRSRKIGGTGLGLSIVKHIVELYEGIIEVESAHHQGTTFRVKLPYSNGE